MPSPFDLGSGRFAHNKFRHTAGVADALTWIVLLAFAAAIIGAAVWGQSQLTNPDSPAARSGMTANQIWTGSIVTLVLFYALVAPAVMLALWLTSVIFKFSLPGGSYLRSAAVAAVPAVLVLGYALAVNTGTLQHNRVVLRIILGLTVPLAALLAKASFGLNVVETMVAALIGVPFGFVGMAVNSGITKAAIAAGASGTPTIAMAPAAPPPSVSIPAPRPSPMVVTPPVRPTPQINAPQATPNTEALSQSNSNEDPDSATIQQLRVDVESFVDSEITPGHTGYLRTRLITLRDRAANLQRRRPNDVTVATIAHQLNDFQLRLDAPLQPTTPAQPPSSALPSVAPGEAPLASLDPADQALAAINSGIASAKKDALKALAEMPVDPTKTQVTRQLEAVVLADDIAVRDVATAALAQWADSVTVLKLLPWLDQSAPPSHAEAAMKILGPTHDKRAVMPIMLWMVKRPEPATAALIELGPVAEDDLCKAVRDPNPDGRKYAARVLQEIGGQKSLIPLQKAAADARNVEAQQAAKIALELVRERYKQSKSGAAKP